MRPSLHNWLKHGGLIAYATESCFGLGCDPRNPHAINKLIKLKQRDQAKGLIVIGDSLKQLRPLLGNLTHAQQAKLRASWPAALTWVCPASDDCHPALTGGRGTIAVRIPAHRGARMLCAQAEMPLVSTSANLSGKKSIRTWQAAMRQFGGRVKIIQGEIGHYRKPSMVCDLASNQILRK